MSVPLSVYLDILRILAALGVFAHHASYDRFGGGWISSLGGYGHEAVVVFFVLSGFVIAYVVDTKEKDVKAYTLARLGRLWSVAVPAVALTLAMDTAGRWLAPDLYSSMSANANVARILSSIFFTNEWWFRHFHVGSNIPFWSLSYEAAYYLLFGILIFCKRPWPLLLIATIVIGPKILLLLPAWMMGVVAYRHCAMPHHNATNLGLAVGGAAFVFVLIFFKLGNIYLTWRWQELLGESIFSSFGHATAFVSDNLIAAGVACHLIGIAGITANLTVNSLIKKNIARISSATFSVYLMHYPALYFFTAVSLAVLGKRVGILISVASLSVGIAFTPVGEMLRRKIRNRGQIWIGMPQVSCANRR